MPDTPPSPQQPSQLDSILTSLQYSYDQYHDAANRMRVRREAEAAILALLTTAKLEKKPARVGIDYHTDGQAGIIVGYNQGLDAQYAAILRRVRGEEI